MASHADTPIDSLDELPAAAPPPERVYRRHAVVTRATHWINAVCIAFLIASGLNIFNAHPALYWGKFGANADAGRRWLEVATIDRPGGGVAGVTRIGPLALDTSGVLGTHPEPGGGVLQQGFPEALTFPHVRDLATARRWHFFFAWAFILNGLVYLGVGLATRHLQDDVWPRLKQLAPASIWRDIIRHAKLDFPRGDDDRHYHVLQRLAYAGTVFLVLPLMVATGLSMSPGFNAALGGALPALFGGRASARSLHFIAMDLTVAFIIVHVAMVVLAGPYNQLRSMITGRYDVGTPKRDGEHRR